MTKKKQSTKRNRTTVRRTLVGVTIPLLGLGAFGAALVLAEDAPPGNLTRNPSFETDPAVEWMPFRGGISQVALPGEAPNGAFGVNVVAGPTADLLEGYSIDDRRPSGGKDVAAGTQFVASAYIRAATPQSIGKLGKIWVRERLDGSLIDRVKTEVKLTGAFQKITTPVYTVQRNGAEIDVYVAQNPAAPGDAFTADLVTLTRNLPPSGAFTFTPASPGAGDTVTFSSPTVADPEGGEVTRAWDLDGDGVFTDATTPTATFEVCRRGTYTVRLAGVRPQRRGDDLLGAGRRGQGWSGKHGRRRWRHQRSDHRPAPAEVQGGQEQEGRARREVRPLAAGESRRQARAQARG